MHRGRGVGIPCWMVKLQIFDFCQGVHFLSHHTVSGFIGRMSGSRKYFFYTLVSAAVNAVHMLAFCRASGLTPPQFLTTMTIKKNGLESTSAWLKTSLD